MKLLQHVTTKGFPINNIVFFIPSVTLWSDASEYVIGGYIRNVLAWGWRITSEWHGKLTFNLLELLESVVTVYMTILQMGQGSHILAFAASSSALRWLHKESCDPVNAESHDAVAIWLGWTLVINEKSLYSQKTKGRENITTDSFSRYFHRSDRTLTKKFNLILPPQKAASFHIKQPLRKVISWISMLWSALTLLT